MFYEPKNGHGLPYNPFKAIVAPRPIGWISTRGAAGDNLAPYSFFNALTDAPPQVMFAGALADSIHNARQSGVFAVNMVAEAAMAAMNATSKALPLGQDEFGFAGVASASPLAWIGSAIPLIIAYYLTLNKLLRKSAT